MSSFGSGLRRSIKRKNRRKLSKCNKYYHDFKGGGKMLLELKVKGRNEKNENPKKGVDEYEKY